MKICNRCQVEKEISDFYSHKNCKDGVSSICKKCTAIQTKAWKLLNADFVKEIGKKYRINNKDSLRERRKQTHIKNKEKENANAKQWREANPERNKEIQKIWRNNNKQRCKETKERWALNNPDKIKSYCKKKSNVIIPQINIDDIDIALLIEGYSANKTVRKMFFEKFNIFYAKGAKGIMYWASCPKCLYKRWVMKGKESTLCGPCNRERTVLLKRVEFREVKEKLCVFCLCEKPISEFYKHPRVKKDGYRNICKDCLTIQNKNWRDNNKEKIKQYERTNAKIKASNPKDRLCSRISSLVRYSLRRKGLNKEGASWREMVDYSPTDLMLHLEKQFKDGMGWHNMNEWHIDHKLPISSFEFSHYTDIGFKQCWALDNLQPLWAMENMKKHNKILTEVGTL
jgi:hypothetical protein